MKILGLAQCFVLFCFVFWLGVASVNISELSRLNWLHTQSVHTVYKTEL